MVREQRMELIHEGKYAAQIPVEVIVEENGWSPSLTLDEAKKLEAVRLALRNGDVAEAAKYGRIFELRPVSV
jgi:hypothetical protein